MDLAGTWRAAPANDELRRVFAEPGYSEAQASSRTGAIEEWTDIDVPGHWRSAARFSDNDGAVLYRRTFSATRPGEDRRVWLKFDGIFYQGDVWLDGAYVGDTEGYYLPHDFDVTEQFNERTEHVVAVEVSCPPQNNQAAKRNLTGMFQSSDHLDRRWNPGGIWQSVHVEETGPIRIKRLRCICLDASTERAELAIRAVVDCARAGTVRLRSDVGTTFHEFDHAVAKGSNRVEWRVVVERPMLWWPLALGRPHMTDVVVSVFDVPTPSAVTLPPVEAEAGATSELGQPSDSRRFRTGLREVRMKNWIFQINGERMHLKGANIGPVRMAIGDATVAELRQDIAAAQDAGLDFLRVNAHVTHPSFYDAADEMGMLVWQDLPLQRGYARSVRKQAVRQAGEAIDLLGHHPSIIHWCGHNEPLAFDADPETMAGSTRKAAELKGRYTRCRRSRPGTSRCSTSRSTGR